MTIKNFIDNTKKIILKNNYKHYKKYKTFDNIYIITIKCIIWGVLGLILGIIINDIVIYLSKILHIRNYIIQDIIQIVLCAILVSFLHTYHKFIGWTLHSTIQGIFFIALLFNVQYKLTKNIEKSYIINNDDNKT